jgi:molybdenum cofactor synthesis domain-containing protein
MDGFAVRSGDTERAPVELVVAGTVAAGGGDELTVEPGHALRIMTGAPVPRGADAVVMVELTSPAGDGRVIIQKAATVGDHVRGAGEDVAAGQEVFGPGTELGPGHLGVLASVGLQHVAVVPSPRVGVLSTGDELVEGGGPLRRGQIRDSNRPMLLALVRQSGYVAVDLGASPDDEAAIEAAVRRGADGCDALLTSGGVSVGDFDYMKTVLDRLGPLRSWQVAVRPAKPLAFATVGATPVFGLPGNPVSAMVSFELFARPALRRMAGQRSLHRPRVAAVADGALRRQPDGKLHLVRVVASWDDDGRCHVRASGGQGSHLLRAMAVANALALLPDGDGVDAGDEVKVLLLG